jgi:hypothetical protein
MRATSFVFGVFLSACGQRAGQPSRGLASHLPGATRRFNDTMLLTLGYESAHRSTSRLDMMRASSLPCRRVRRMKAAAGSRSPISQAEIIRACLV